MDKMTEIINKAKIFEMHYPGQEQAFSYLSVNQGGQSLTKIDFCVLVFGHNHLANRPYFS